MKYPCIVIHTDYPLAVVDIEDVETSFDQAKEVWEARGCPELWIFNDPGEAPWRCGRKTKNSK